MKEIFKYGNHIAGGISLTYLESLQIYSFMITFLLVHFNIDQGNGTLRFGFSIGDHGIYFRFQIGFN